MGTEITVDKTSAYLALPDDVGPCLILIHEVWGLNAHIRDVADRFAAEGYVVLAPDLLSKTGIPDKVSPELMRRADDPATRDEAQKEMRAAMAPMQSPEFAAETLETLKGCYEFLRQHEATTGIVAVIGFCFGGTYAFALAAEEPDLACAIPFYGHSEGIMEKLDQILAPILAFYGEQDTALVSTLPDLEEAMAEHDVEFSYVAYEGTGHAFFNDTNPSTYNEAAAKDSWNKSLAFLSEHTS